MSKPRSVEFLKLASTYFYLEEDGSVTIITLGSEPVAFEDKRIGVLLKQAVEWRDKVVELNTQKFNPPVFEFTSLTKVKATAPCTKCFKCLPSRYLEKSQIEQSVDFQCSHCGIVCRLPWTMVRPALKGEN